MSSNLPEPAASAAAGQADVRRRNRQLENITRILIESYEETARHSLLVARDSDLRTGGTRIAALTAERQPFRLWGEAFLGGALAVLWATGLSKLVPEDFGAFLSAILTWCGPAQPISPEESRDFGATLIGLGVLALIGVSRWWGHWRLSQARQRVIDALQRVSELYLSHSGMNANLQRAGHQRVQVEARMHPFAGLGWRQLEEAGGTETIRRHLDRLAEIDSARALDEAAFERAGGEYWLELLRAGLRGDLPLVICTYAADALDANRQDGRARFTGRLRRRALELCAAERRLGGKTSEPQGLAYRRLQTKLRRVRGYSIAEFDALLDAWDAPLLPLRRETPMRRVFEHAFRRSE